jgi:putative N6-adenine-specific DNA methylase/tRNA (guanine6-N2)-methyltransferase
MTELYLTTNPGIEDVVIREVPPLLTNKGFEVRGVEAQPGGREGVVAVSIEATADAATRAAIRDAVAGARSIYHAVLHVAAIEWEGESAADLAHRLAALPLDAMNGAASFRATCSRVGEHPFHSPDLERELGTALQARYGTPVNLTEWDLNIRVDLDGADCRCGYQLSGRKGLDRRYDWRYHPRVTLRTTVAYAMLEIAGFVTSPGALHDPFCGSGTILLEAAALLAAASVTPAPAATGVPISGSDRAARAVEGARENLQANGRQGIPVSRLDARDLSEALPPASLEYVVTNPPYGIRMGHHSDFGELYRLFLREASIVLRPGGFLAILVGRRRASFNKALQTMPEFRLRHVRIIEIGGVYPGLFVLERVPG